MLTNRLDDNCPPALVKSQELLQVREAHCSVSGPHPEPVTPQVGLLIHATVDLGQKVEWISQQLELEAGENGCLAVLHNRNDMSIALNSSDWVVNSKGRVISRGVTSSAGVTAQHVVLAQTKIGFLTGGGHDLGRFEDYDICVRTDKHSQSICGPSVTPLEFPGRDGTHHVSLVALGGSKAMQEFLVSHYMATDSAEEWDSSGPMPTSVHMGTCWLTEGACHAHV